MEDTFEERRLHKKRLIHFLVAIALLGVVGGLYETTLGNFLAEVYDVTTRQRGNIEFPREMPGFLVTLVAGAFSAMALNRVGAVAMLLVSGGLVGLAFAPERFALMMVFMVIWSTGAHLNMPVSESITLGLASRSKRATMLGQVGAAGVMGTIVGAGIVAVAMRRGWVSYRGVYLMAAAFAFAAGISLLSMGRTEKEGQPRRRAFVFKRRYSLFYVLCALFGARKQIFMTFGPWFLIMLFARQPYTFAHLWIIYSVAGLAVRPLAGRLIDHWGERKSLFLDGIVLSLVCATYAVAGHHTESSIALYAAMTAYVVDQLCFSISIARTTYLSHIVERQEDLAGGLAAGVSIDHAVSMSVPALGGLVWATFGFQYVFWGAAAIALTSSAVSLFIRTGREDGASED